MTMGKSENFDSMMWNDLLVEAEGDDTAYQDKVKQGYAGRKNKILTGGKASVKSGAPFNIDPPKQRSKSAPPGAGVFENLASPNEVDDIEVGDTVYWKDYDLKSTEKIAFKYLKGTVLGLTSDGRFKVHGPMGRVVIPRAYLSSVPLTIKEVQNNQYDEDDDINIGDTVYFKKWSTFLGKEAVWVGKLAKKSLGFLPDDFSDINCNSKAYLVRNGKLTGQKNEERWTIAVQVQNKDLFSTPMLNESQQDNQHDENDFRIGDRVYWRKWSHYYNTERIWTGIIRDYSFESGKYRIDSDSNAYIYDNGNLIGNQDHTTYTTHVKEQDLFEDTPLLKESKQNNQDDEEEPKFEVGDGVSWDTWHGKGYGKILQVNKIGTPNKVDYVYYVRSNKSDSVYALNEYSLSPVSIRESLLKQDNQHDEDDIEVGDTVFWREFSSYFGRRGTWFGKIERFSGRGKVWAEVRLDHTSYFLDEHGMKRGNPDGARVTPTFTKVINRKDLFPSAQRLAEIPLEEAKQDNQYDEDDFVGSGKFHIGQEVWWQNDWGRSNTGTIAELQAVEGFLLNNMPGYLIVKVSPKNEIPYLVPIPERDLYATINETQDNERDESDFEIGDTVYWTSFSTHFNKRIIFVGKIENLKEAPSAIRIRCVRKGYAYNPETKKVYGNLDEGTFFQIVEERLLSLTPPKTVTEHQDNEHDEDDESFVYWEGWNTKEDQYVTWRGTVLSADAFNYKVLFATESYRSKNHPNFENAGKELIVNVAKVNALLSPPTKILDEWQNNEKDEEEAFDIGDTVYWKGWSAVEHEYVIWKGRVIRTPEAGETLYDVQFKTNCYNLAKPTSYSDTGETKIVPVMFKYMTAYKPKDVSELKEASGMAAGAVQGASGNVFGLDDEEMGRTRKTVAEIQNNQADEDDDGFSVGDTVYFDGWNQRYKEMTVFKGRISRLPSNSKAFQVEFYSHANALDKFQDTGSRRLAVVQKEEVLRNYRER